MASELILDKKDPGVAEMVSAWEDGADYDIGGMKVRQMKTEGDLVYFDVLDLPEGSASESMEEGEESGTEKKPMRGKPAIMIAFGR